MTSLVTGSSGLLGKCLIERLEEHDGELRLLDLEPPPTAMSRHTFFQADAADEAAMREAARGVEVIYHLAAAQRMKPQFSNWTETEIFKRNFDSVRNVLHVAATSDVRKVVFVSSSGVYGKPQQALCAEDHPTLPLGAYGRSKLLTEEACLEAIEGDAVSTAFTQAVGPVVELLNRC